jgi:pimeloyl-ACP methyl ester carboxylesterase
VLGASLVRTAVGPVEAAVVGAGPVVLLVHGTPGSWRQLAPLADDLVPGHTVVLPSRPGYGATPLAAGRTPDEQADAYAGLLDALAVDRAAVVGVSGGGPSAAAFAARHAGRTSALVLCCPLAVDRFGVPPAMRVAALPGVGEALTALARRSRRRMLADPAALERRMRAELSPTEAAALDDDQRAAMVRFYRSHLDAPPGLAGFRNDLAQARAGRGLPANVLAPTLVLHGDADTVVPVDHGRAYADAIAGSRLEVLADASHGFLLTRPTEVVPGLVRFIEEHP